MKTYEVRADIIARGSMIGVNGFTFIVARTERLSDGMLDIRAHHIDEPNGPLTRLNLHPNDIVTLYESWSKTQS